MSARTDARLLQSAFSGGYGGGYPFGGRSNLVDLIMARGMQQAEATRAQGQMWGDAINSIGQNISGAITQHAEEQKIKKRDAAWLDFVNKGDWMSDPRAAYTESLRIWGPEKGPQQFQALAGASQLLQPKRDPEKDGKALVSLGRGADSMTPEGRAAAWPQLRALAHSVYPQMNLPEQYDDAFWSKTLRPAISGMEPPKEGFTLGPGQQRFGADGKPIASVAPEVKPEPGFSLGPGETRYDASGKPIASRPAAPPAPSREHFWVVRNGMPLRVSESEYRPGDLPASTREQGRPVTSGDAGRLADFDTAMQDLDIMKKRTSGEHSTGVVAQAGTWVPNFVTEWTGLGADAKGQQAMVNLQKQTIGKTLEGGVLRKEDEVKYDKILLRVGDPPQVAQQKLAQMADLIQRKRQNLVDNLKDAGYDVSRFEARSGGLAPEDDALLKKYGF